MSEPTSKDIVTTKQPWADPHVIAAVGVPCILCAALLIFAPGSAFSSQSFVTNQISGELVYCVAGVFWFGWRWGGETPDASWLPRRFWIASIVIFVITMMLYSYAAWAGESDVVLARYPTYYLAYVLLTNLVLTIAQRKVGAPKHAQS